MRQRWPTCRRPGGCTPIWTCSPPASSPPWTTPQPGGLTWGQLTALTSAALATDGCAAWSVCIYNPDLDPGRDGADAIISYVTEAITTTDQPAH